MNGCEATGDLSSSSSSGKRSGSGDQRVGSTYPLGNSIGFNSSVSSREWFEKGIMQSKEG